MWSLTFPRLQRPPAKLLVCLQNHGTLPIGRWEASAGALQSWTSATSEPLIHTVS